MGYRINITKHCAAGLSLLALSALAACASPSDSTHEEATESAASSDGIGEPFALIPAGERAADAPSIADSSDVTAPTDLKNTTAERALAAKLGLPGRFNIGLGNDAEGGDPYAASGFRLGPKLDIHYMYLSGLPGEGGWANWNSPEGHYVTMWATAARTKGVVPMFTLYQAAAWGEGNLSAFGNWDFMTKYMRGVRVMFQRLGQFGSPAITHIEPDLWGYFQQRFGDDPAKAFVQIGVAPECAGLPNDAAGFGKCIVRMARTYAPKTMVGLSASSFGAYTNGVSDPTRIGAYLTKVGGAQADLVVIETLDRDAGCFENGSDPNCKRSGSFYWDETNVRHPNFRDHLAWARGIRNAVGRPLLWWQMPLGVPSGTPGGWAGHYRDNRVRYLFSHAWEYAQAGGIGAVFGTGAPNQTTVRTDGGQFKNALTKYLAAGGNGLL